MGLEVLDDLVDSGDLDPAIRDEMPTFTPNLSVVEWTLEAHGFGASVRTPTSEPLDPCDYLLLLDPNDPTCN